MRWTNLYLCNKKEKLHAAQTLLTSQFGPPLRLTLCHNLAQTGLIIFSPDNRDGNIPRKVIHTALKKAEVGTCLVLHMNSLLCYHYHYHWQRHLERVAEKPMSSRYGKQLLDAWPLQDSIIVTSLCSALHPQCVTTCLFLHRLPKFCTIFMRLLSNRKATPHHGLLDKCCGQK